MAEQRRGGTGGILATGDEEAKQKLAEMAAQHPVPPPAAEGEPR
jgi:hypothetical protein